MRAQRRRQHRQDPARLVHVDLYIVVEYGTNIATVSRNLIDQVSFALKEYARVPLAGVDVHVMDVKVRR